MFQFTCGDFLIIGVLIGNRIALAGEQQLADAPAITKCIVAHPCIVGWKSLLHIQFLKLKDDCSESKRASDTRLGPQKVLSNNPGIIYCRMLFFIQYFLYNSHLDDLLEEYLPGLIGPKESGCLILLGSELFHGLDADGAPKPVGSSETCSPDGVGWELSLLSNSVLSARGLKET